MFVILKQGKRRASQLLGKRGFDYLIVSSVTVETKKTRLDVTDRDCLDWFERLSRSVTGRAGILGYVLQIEIFKFGPLVCLDL